VSNALSMTVRTNFGVRHRDARLPYLTTPLHFSSPYNHHIHSFLTVFTALSMKQKQKLFLQIIFCVQVTTAEAVKLCMTRYGWPWPVNGVMTGTLQYEPSPSCRNIVGEAVCGSSFHAALNSPINVGVKEPFRVINLSMLVDGADIITDLGTNVRFFQLKFN